MGHLAAAAWEELVEQHDDGTAYVAIVDSDFILRAASPKAHEVFGLEADEVIGASAADLIHPIDLERALRVFTEAQANEGLRPPDVYRIRQGADVYKSFDVSGETLPGGEAVVFRLRELGERRKAEVLAIEQIEILEMISAGHTRDECLMALANMCERHVDGALAIVHVAQPDGLLHPVTTGLEVPALRNLRLGAPLTQPGGNLAEAGRRGFSFVELSLAELDHWAPVAEVLETAQYRSCITTPAISPGGDLIGFIEVLRQTGERPGNDEMAVHALVARMIGLVVDRLTFEAALSAAAFTDELTGLGNRRKLQDTLDGLTKAREPFGLLGIDLDQFAWVNNNLGHAAGDLMLRAVSGRLEMNLPVNATAFRPGGDEFVIVVRGERRSEELLALAQETLHVLREPVDLGSTMRRINASIGIAKFLADDTDPDRILARADAAMYAAKRDGGAGVRLFSEPIGAKMMRRMALADELPGAIEFDQLRLIYQPVIDLQSLAVVGAEALVRWEHPTLGLLGPDEFVPIAEESNLILALDEWVLRAASRQLGSWADHRGEECPLDLWVNISARSLVRPDLAPMVLGLNPVAGGRLGLELTERDAFDDSTNPVEAFAELRRHGIQIAMDDFGTGRASLHRIAVFEPTTIKIDRSFVNEMIRSDRVLILVETILDIARRFDLVVIAEGVEHRQQLELLQEMGCHHAQGFLFARPMVPTDLETEFGPRLDGIWRPGAVARVKRSYAEGS